jgi:hypothetical protein
MFQIRWRKSVSRRLLDECSKAEESLLTAILAAMSDVEFFLQNDPEFVGESRDADNRVLIIEPLCVTYKVNHRQRRVVIVRAKVRHPQK